MHLPMSNFLWRGAISFILTGVVVEAVLPHLYRSGHDLRILAIVGITAAIWYTIEVAITRWG
jgi:hypothetical protein